MAQNTVTEQIKIPEFGMDPFGGFDEPQEAIKDFPEFEQVPAEVVAPKKQKYEVSHAALRPRCIEGALTTYSVGKSGIMTGFDNEEWAIYIEANGGRSYVSVAKNASVIVLARGFLQSAVDQAKSNAQQIKTEDEFFTYLLKKGIKSLQEQWELKKNAFKNIKSKEDIEKQVMAMQWVSYEDCLTPITLREIDKICGPIYTEQQKANHTTDTQTTKATEVPENGQTHLEESNRTLSLQLSKPDLSDDAALKKQQVNPESKVQSQKTNDVPINWPVFQLPQQLFQKEEIKGLEKPGLAKQYAPQTVLEISNQTTKNIIQHLKDNKLVLVTGATGIGKTTTIKLIVKELQYQYLTSYDTAILGEMITTRSFNNDIPKVIVIEDVEEVDKLINLIAKFGRRQNNRIIMTTSNPFDAKLKSLKKLVQEVKFVRSNTKEILLQIFKKERASNLFFQQAPQQVVNQVVNEITDKCQADLRQSILQFEFQLRNAGSVQKIFQQISSFEFAKQVFCNTNSAGFVDQYYQDPFMYHNFLAQNYQAVGGYATRYTLYVSELLSFADNQHYKMFKEGDWSTSKSAAISETYLISIACNMVKNITQLTFPSQIMSTKSQNLQTQFDQAVMLSPTENKTCIEVGLNILDASWHLGFDKLNPEEYGLSMNLGDEIKQVIETMGLKYSTGKKKQELIQWVQDQEQIEVLDKPQKRGKK